jgi:hypothetical protein
MAASSPESVRQPSIIVADARRRGDRAEPERVPHPPGLKAREGRGREKVVHQLKEAPLGHPPKGSPQRPDHLEGAEV